MKGWPPEPLLRILQPWGRGSSSWLPASTTTNGRFGRGTWGRPVFEAGPGFRFTAGTLGVDGELGIGPAGVVTFLGPGFEGFTLATGCFGAPLQRAAPHSVAYDLWPMRHWFHFRQLRTTILTFIVTRQLKVTGDSICNSCNVFPRASLNTSKIQYLSKEDGINIARIANAVQCHN